MSRIPVDLPPDVYPRRERRRGKGSMIFMFLVLFAVFFALTWLALEFL